jgi:competence protein ComEA
MWVQVAGAVRHPGVYEVPAGSRVFQAVLQAGGFADEADQEAVALAALLTDGCRIYIPRAGEAGEGGVETPTQSSEGVTGGMTGEEPSGGVSKAGVVSLNSAILRA